MKSQVIQLFTLYHVKGCFLGGSEVETQFALPKLSPL